MGIWIPGAGGYGGGGGGFGGAGGAGVSESDKGGWWCNCHLHLGIQMVHHDKYPDHPYQRGGGLDCPAGGVEVVVHGVQLMALEVVMVVVEVVAETL